jgi:hypothetical protein
MQIRRILSPFTQRLKFGLNTHRLTLFHSMFLANGLFRMLDLEAGVWDPLLGINMSERRVGGVSSGGAVVSA